MVQKLKDAKLNVLPYLEITLKPGDTRPITVVMPETEGSVQISPGTADDMAELLGALGLIRQVIAAALNVRLMHENYGTVAKEIVVEPGEDLPF